MALPQADYLPAGLWRPADLDALQGNPEPRIGTPQQGVRSLGGILSAFDDVFGFPLMPWQCLVADRAMAVDADGRWVHQTAAAIVARQNGKTTLAARRILAGLFVLGDGNLLHLAQDRALPRQVFTEVADIIADQPDLHRHLKARSGIRYANGQEAIALKDGSTYRILAPSEAAVRGYPRVGFVLFDEVRTQQVMAVWSAVQYTQRSHPNPTRWAISNAGDPDSVVLNMLRDRGRAAASDPGSDPAMGWWEWSAPDEAPIDDPTQWPLANPALGVTLRGTTLLDEMRSDDEAGFRTEALCQWVEVTTQQAIPWDMWEACAADIDPLTPGDDLRSWWAIDLDTERRVASLVITAEVDDRLVAGVHRQWTADEVDEGAIADEVEALWAEWSPQGIAFDPHTCQGLVDRKPGLPWEKVTGTDWVIACSQLLDAVQTGYLAHANQAELNSQLAVAGRRDFGDGSWRISRKDSTHPIPAVVALARAVHLSTQAGGVAITVL